MQKILTKLLKKNHKKPIVILVPLFVLATTISIYSFSMPATTIKQNDMNQTKITTTYDYKATVTPNVLYPNGGTMEVGNTLFKKITTTIPFELKTTINSSNEVIAKGTYELELVINANDLWKKSFPLVQKQSFEKQGTALSIFENTYTINIGKIDGLIKQIEEETGIRSSQYTLEVIPTISGTVSYAGSQKEIQAADKLIFDYSFDNITLASDKSFTSTIPFGTTEIITNPLNLAGIALPIASVRLISTTLSILALLAIAFFNKTMFVKKRTRIPSQIDIINNKYGNRIIPIYGSKHTNQKSIISLTSFKSVLKISDDLQLPIFFQNIRDEGRIIYFIVDGDYLYNFEMPKIDIVRSTDTWVERSEAYAKN